MRLCVLQSLLASASGVILRARHPGQPQRERLIPALGAKPREAHSAGLSCGSPSQPQKGRQHVPCSPLWFCFCPVGREVDVVPFCWSVTELQTETNFRCHCLRCRPRQAMVPGLSLLDCLQLQKLKVFALPPLSQGLSFLSPAHQPPPKIAPCWNTLCECEDEARGFGVS